jgi:hypothetical protein
MMRFSTVSSIATTLVLMGISAQAVQAETQRLFTNSVFLNFRSDLPQTVKGFGISATGLLPTPLVSPAGKTSVMLTSVTGDRDTVSKAFRLQIDDAEIRLSAGGVILIGKTCRLASVNIYESTLTCTVTTTTGATIGTIPLIRFVGDSYNAFTQPVALFSTAYPVSMVVTPELANALKSRLGRVVVTEGYFLGTANGRVGQVVPPRTR